MARSADRNPASAPGDWYIDTHCIDCAASREVAPGLIVHRHGKSVFARQPETEAEEAAAWRAALVCPTASVGTESHHSQPPGVFPHELAPGIYRCGFNARSSFGAHSYFAKRAEGNLLIDAPRYVNKLVQKLADLGGVDDILLTHRDDVVPGGGNGNHGELGQLLQRGRAQRHFVGNRYRSLAQSIHQLVLATRRILTPVVIEPRTPYVGLQGGAIEEDDVMTHGRCSVRVYGSRWTLECLSAKNANGGPLYIRSTSARSL